MTYNVLGGTLNLTQSNPIQTTSASEYLRFSTAATPQHQIAEVICSTTLCHATHTDWDRKACFQSVGADCVECFSKCRAAVW